MQNVQGGERRHRDTSMLRLRELQPTLHQKDAAQELVSGIALGQFCPAAPDRHLAALGGLLTHTSELPAQLWKV